MTIPTAIKNTYIVINNDFTPINNNNIKQAHDYITAIGEDNNLIVQLIDKNIDIELQIIGKTLYELLESNTIKKHHIKDKTDLGIK